MRGMRRGAFKMRCCTVVAVAGLAGSGTAPHAAIFDIDDRRLVDTSPGSPFSPIGLILGSKHYGTATLIDRCHALTARHLLDREGGPIGKRMTFVGAVGSKHPIKSDGTVIAAGELERGQFRQLEARGADWMLLKLDTCLGDTLGWGELVVKPSNVSELLHVQSAGFPSDTRRRRGLTIDPDCAILSVRPLVWLNDCATLPGNSGGPIFRLIARAGRQHMEVLAIQTAAVRERRPVPLLPGWANQATPAWQILPYILRMVGPKPGDQKSVFAQNRQEGAVSRQPAPRR